MQSPSRPKFVIDFALQLFFPSHQFPKAFDNPDVSRSADPGQEEESEREDH